MKIYIQIVDTNTGIYQTGMIEEPVMHGKEIENALMHFGVSYAHIKWHSKNQLLNIGNNFGEVEGTSKVVSIVTLEGNNRE
jgi:hypothetical protein